MPTRGVGRLASILVAAVVVTIGSWVASPPANAATVAPTVVLYDAADYAGSSGRTILTRSEPNLQEEGWSQRVSSVQIHGGIMIAVYSEINYQGTCTPVVGGDPWLGNDAVGNDRVGSVLFYASCSGIVIDPVVTAITAVNSASDPNVQCPANYVRRDKDLNDGAGGDYIHLCLRFESRSSAGARIVEDVETFSSTWETRWLCGPATEYWEDPGGTRAGGDLNANAGGQFVYLCSWTYADRHPHRFGRPLVPPIRDVEFAWSDTSLDYPEWSALCANAFPDVVDGTASSPWTRHLGTNLNYLAGGDYIQACSLRYEAVLAEPPSDLEPPTITFDRRTAPNANGWNNSAVTLWWNCSDSGGVVSSVVKALLLGEGRNQSASGTCEDLFGRVSSDTQSGISIDLTAPLTTRDGRTPANANGWNNTDVQVRWNCKDSLSGPARLVETVSVTTEGAAQTATGRCADLAGNTTPDTVNGINIDKTAPTVIVSTSSDPSVFGWHRWDVALSWSCADTGGSGLAEPCPAGSTVTGEGRDLRSMATVRDRAGNTGHGAVLVNIDRTAPVVDVTATTADGRTYQEGTWTDQDVRVTFTCTDALSGVASVTPSTTLRDEGADQSVEGTCVDKAGNKARAVFRGINIDKSAPTMACSADPSRLWPPNHRLVRVNVSVETTDEQSGSAELTLVSATSSEPDDGRGDGNTRRDIRDFEIGTADTDGLLRAERSGRGDGRVYTLTYRATDLVGNAATCEATVTVPHHRSR